MSTSDPILALALGMLAPLSQAAALGVLAALVRPFPCGSRRERLFDLWSRRRRWRAYRRGQRRA